MTYCYGEARPQAKLRTVDVVAIKVRAFAGERLMTIAASYPQVSRVAVHHIIHGRRWKHVSIPDHVADPALLAEAASSGKETYVSGSAA